MVGGDGLSTCLLNTYLLTYLPTYLPAYRDTGLTASACITCVGPVPELIDRQSLMMVYVGMYVGR